MDINKILKLEQIQKSKIIKYGKIVNKNEDLDENKIIEEKGNNVLKDNLNEEIEKCLKQHNMLAVGKKDFTDIAKYFFELGLKAQKGE